MTVKNSNIKNLLTPTKKKTANLMICSFFFLNVRKKTKIKAQLFEIELF